MRWAVIALLFLSASLAVACGSSDDDTEPFTRSQVCAPGKSEPCAGPGGCQGGQVCNEGGSGYDECVCEDQNESRPSPADVCIKPQVDVASCVDQSRRSFGQCSEHPKDCDRAPGTVEGVYCCDP